MKFKLEVTDQSKSESESKKTINDRKNLLIKLTPDFPLFIPTHHNHNGNQG